MTKKEFLNELGIGLRGLPASDISERQSFYSEMIDDRIEDGLSEEEAVAQIGPVDKIVSQILMETPLPTIIKEKVKKKNGFKAWEVLLLVFGFPVWFPLMIAAFAIIISIFAVIWSLVLAAWAVFVSFVAGAAGGMATGAFCLIQGKLGTGFGLMSVSVVLAGLAIFMFYACKWITKGAAILVKNICLGIKHIIVGK
ncbi:MAG: DUF1700 domain-containing protein [Lachnospiraceae bacterium]|nr:DUF1700 domain-containing protein [Lachnospiraceae bacterium]